MIFIQMSGIPGSGKSTLAKEISKRIDVIILDHDIIKTSLIGFTNEKKKYNNLIRKLKWIWTNKFLNNFSGDMSYTVIWSLAEYYLAQGKNVLIDSPCFYTEGLEKGISISEKYNAQYKYIECILDDLDEINSRLNKRERMPSQVRDMSKNLFNQWIEKTKRPQNKKYIKVNTSQPINNYIDEVIKYIES